MKKSSFVALLLGTVSGVFFALGMCMALIQEWNSFRPGVILGCAGLLLGGGYLAGMAQDGTKTADPHLRQDDSHRGIWHCGGAGARRGNVLLYGLGKNGIWHRSRPDRNPDAALPDSIDKRHPRLSGG